jgi:DNA-binding IclR family transcriptional regulator
MSSVSGSGERILAILDLFTEARPEWSPEEMMAVLGYSRPTFYRYLKTLKDSGFLTSRPAGGVALGPRVTELDYLMTRSDPMIRFGRPELEQIAQRFPGSAFLVRWYGRKLLCVDSVVSADRPRSSYPRGRPMPLGRGAISRAIVAWLPAPERRRLVEDYLPEFAGVGVGDSVDDVLGALRETRREGVACARGEVTPGVIGVAGPVLGPDRRPQGALCLSSAAGPATEARLDDIRAAMREAAQRLSAALGVERPAARAPRRGDRAAESAIPNGPGSE